MLMSLDSKGVLPPDPGQKTLRAALDEARQYMSPARMLNLTADYTKVSRTFMTSHALRDFIAEKTGELSEANYRPLAELWLASPVGRALRKIDPKKATPFDHLMRTLANGIGSLPDGIQVVGRYYLYHGSYLLPGHYVVRRLAIETGDDHVLSVEDIVRDTKTATNAPRRAAGVMMFVDGRPQILLHADENKQGLSLVVFHDIGPGKGDLDRCYGAFMVMNQRRELAFRPCLLVRENVQSSADMLAETGIFTVADLREPSRQRHAQAFDQLKELMVAQPFADPMLAWEMTHDRR
jgi:hypothetical protein